MIHQYKLNGYNIVLDVFSGSVHVVDDVAYDAIALYETRAEDEVVAELLMKYGARADVNEKELRGLMDDIRALKDAGKLYTEDEYRDFTKIQGQLNRISHSVDSLQLWLQKTIADGKIAADLGSGVEE